MKTGISVRDAMTVKPVTAPIEARVQEIAKLMRKGKVGSIVITNKNKVKNYKEYGDAVDKRYVKLRLNKLLKLAKKLQR